MNKRRAVTLFLLIVATLLLYSLRERSILLLNIAPPDDLFSKIVDEKIRLDATIEKYEFFYKQPYIGKYLFGFYLEKSPSSSTGISTSARISARVKVGETEVFHSAALPWSGIFWTSDGEGGVILGFYNATTASLNATVKVELFIQETDPEFKKKYGNVSFFVKRASDM